MCVAKIDESDPAIRIVEVIRCAFHLIPKRFHDVRIGRVRFDQNGVGVAPLQVVRESESDHAFANAALAASDQIYGLGRIHAQPPTGFRYQV